MIIILLIAILVTLVVFAKECFSTLEYIKILIEKYINATQIK